MPFSEVTSGLSAPRRGPKSTDPAVAGPVYCWGVHQRRGAPGCQLRRGSGPAGEPGPGWPAGWQTGYVQAGPGSCPGPGDPRGLRGAGAGVGSRRALRRTVPCSGRRHHADPGRGPGQASLLELAGAYRPPLRGLGAGLDRAIMHRVATATTRTFMNRVAGGIAHSLVPLNENDKSPGPRHHGDGLRPSRIAGALRWAAFSLRERSAASL